jgi:glutathione synthase/RimK-type ligase-like ATP-grasp enzyme
MEEQLLRKIVKEICREEGIGCRTFSHGWIIRLKKGGVCRYITGNNFDLNTEASARIACDKAATYETLHALKIPAVEHMLVLNPATRAAFIPAEGNWKAVERFFEEHGREIVVKPNGGRQGRGCHLCRTVAEVEHAIHTLFLEYDAIALSPFYRCEREYRVYSLDGKPAFVYAKRKPSVTGNGVDTAAALVERRYQNLEWKKRLEFMNAADWDTIPADGETVELSWKFNLSGGASCETQIDAATQKKIYALAEKVARGINLRFGTIDILQTESGLLLLEVNSGIGMSKFVGQTETGYETIKEIIRRSISLMFEQ